MNGRVYDPTVGRFLSVDPVYQAPTNSQSVNPYSYVMNNPLSLTDSTGYFIDGSYSEVCIDFTDCTGSENNRDDKGSLIKRAPNNGATLGQRADSDQHKPSDPSSVGSPTTSPDTSGAGNPNDDKIDPKANWVMEYSGDGKTVKFTLEDDQGNPISGKGNTLDMNLSQFKSGAEFQVLHAIQYDESGGWGAFRDLASSGHDTDIMPASMSRSGGDEGGIGLTHYSDGHYRVDPGERGKIYFDPTSALRVSSGGIQSAAIGLGHEAEHVVQGIRNPDQYYRDLNTSVRGFSHGQAEESNVEEQRVIRGPESHYANQLGEPTRDWHDGTPVNEPCSTCRTPPN